MTNCPNCGHYETKVNDSRPRENGEVIYRYRTCLNCNERFSTYEQSEKTIRNQKKRLDAALNFIKSMCDEKINEENENDISYVKRYKIKDT